MRQQIATEQERTAVQQRLPLAGRHMPAADSRVLAILERTVELDVIPRLLLARRGEGHAAHAAASGPVPGSPVPVAAQQVASLVRMLLARDESVSSAYVHALHRASVPTETLYLDLLAPAARQLGQMWVDDDCDFTDVTVGLFMLQNVLRELGSLHPEDAACRPDAPRALLVPLPNQQHTFGLSMVSDFFRRGGWGAWSGPVDSDGALAAMVGGAWFDMVGFSLACDEQLEPARRAIQLVRRMSLNPDVIVMVGGPGFTDNPGLATLIGADGTATDGPRAVQQADALLAHIKRGRGTD